MREGGALFHISLVKHLRELVLGLATASFGVKSPEVGIIRSNVLGAMSNAFAYMSGALRGHIAS